MFPSLQILPASAPFLATVGATGFCVVMPDADAPEHVYAHYATWPAAVHAVRTAYPFGQVVPAEGLLEAMAA